MSKFLCEDPTVCQPDEFFGIFNQFVTAFHDALSENARFKREKEQEAQRAEKEAQVGKYKSCKEGMSGQALL